LIIEAVRANKNSKGVSRPVLMEHIRKHHPEVKDGMVRAVIRRGLESGWLAPHHIHKGSCE
jgi:hypothetical protein